MLLPLRKWGSIYLIPYNPCESFRSHAAKNVSAYSETFYSAEILDQFIGCHDGNRQFTSVRSAGADTAARPRSAASSSRSIATRLDNFATSILSSCCSLIACCRALRPRCIISPSVSATTSSTNRRCLPSAAAMRASTSGLTSHAARRCADLCGTRLLTPARLQALHFFHFASASSMCAPNRKATDKERLDSHHTASRLPR